MHIKSWHLWGVAAVGFVCLTGCSDDGAPPSVDQGVHDAKGADLSASDLAREASPPDSAADDGTIADTAASDLASDSVGSDLTSDLPVGSDLTSDLPGTFLQEIAGIWLIGWRGNVNHYSWLRVTPTSATGGKATILDGKTLTANTPYWGCNGSMSFNLTAKPRTIQLQFSSSSCNGMKSSRYTFGKLVAAGATPKGALQKTQVVDSSAAAISLKGFLFPATQCDAALKTCVDPLR